MACCGCESGLQTHSEAHSTKSMAEVAVQTQLNGNSTALQLPFDT
jgi:hypothetical protein